MTFLLFYSLFLKENLKNIFSTSLEKTKRYFFCKVAILRHLQRQMGLEPVPARVWKLFHKLISFFFSFLDFLLKFLVFHTRKDGARAGARHVWKLFHKLISFFPPPLKKFSKGREIVLIFWHHLQCPDRKGDVGEGVLLVPGWHHSTHLLPF